MSVVIPISTIRKRLRFSENSSGNFELALKAFSEMDDQIKALVSRLTTPSEEVAREIRKIQSLKPSAGTVVRVESFRHLDLGCERAELVYPVNLLLDEIVGDLSACGVWRGWIMTRDIHYASHFDLLRAGDPNFCEEGCAVIQCWNPVLVYEGCIHEVVGRMSQEKLDAARKLSSDFARSVVPAESDVGRFGKPGDLIYRQINGTWHQTGCWLDRMAPDDMRNEYIDLYGEFARSVNAPVEQALAAREQATTVGPATAASKIPDALGTGLALAANRAASVFLSWADTVTSAFRLESTEPALFHAAGGQSDRFVFERGEYVDVDVDYDTKIVKVSSCFDPEGRCYKLFFLNDDNEVVAHVPREKRGYLSIERFDGDFEEHCPEIVQGLKMEIREVRELFNQ